MVLKTIPVPAMNIPIKLDVGKQSPNTILPSGINNNAMVKIHE